MNIMKTQVMMVRLSADDSIHAVCCILGTVGTVRQPCAHREWVMKDGNEPAYWWRGVSMTGGGKN